MPAGRWHGRVGRIGHKEFPFAGGQAAARTLYIPPDWVYSNGAVSASNTGLVIIMKIVAASWQPAAFALPLGPAATSKLQLETGLVCTLVGSLLY